MKTSHTILSRNEMKDVVLTSDWQHGQNPSALFNQEWLVTNGLGGYASGTVIGVPTRKYHGLFVPNLPIPSGRTIMIPRLDVAIEINNQIIPIGGGESQEGHTSSQSHHYLKEFKLVWQIPHWVFEIGKRVFEMRLTMLNRQNTVYVELKLLQGDSFRVSFRPYLNFRGHDALLGTTPDYPFGLHLKKGHCEVQPFDGAPLLRMGLRPQQGVFVADNIQQEKVFYRLEKERGLECEENITSPGYFSTELTAEKPVAFVTSTELWENLTWEAPEIFEAEQHRLKKILAQAPPAAHNGFAAHLVLAADQFIVAPGTRLQERTMGAASGEHLRTIIAGYHWFGDWGRDTMISLEGLTLSTGRHEEAKAILRTFSTYVKDGLLPNLFPEGERTPLYHTVDATLWFFHAMDRYYQITKDSETLQFLYPIFENIIDFHIKGTHFGIQMDPADGLIKSGQKDYALTWMDAKVKNWVVTPRRGKPVEIQALWYNALCLMAEWSKELNLGVNNYKAIAEKAYSSFNTRFWNESGHYLFDVINGDSGEDSSLRPNQILALALHFPILKKDRWKSVVDTVTDRLLTPVGLRTLNVNDVNFHARYEGDRLARDSAYHQGMVWAWLIGPYLDARRKVYPGKLDNELFFNAFERHLKNAGVGTISEIFDGIVPHQPRGCIAQAWSVAEVLRSYLMNFSSVPS